VHRVSGPGEGTSVEEEMTRLRGLTAIAAFLGLTCFARAEEPDRSTVAWTFGVGAESCGDYLQAADAERKIRPPDAAQGAIFTSAYAKYVDFTDGYLSAYNAVNVTPHRM
jgi:hypothetical protein